MGITVYGSPLSTNVARVLVALQEKNVTDFELVKVDLMTGAPKSPEFMAMQPFGQVPLLLDGQLALFESRAIIRYLADKFEGQGTPLYGSSSLERALVDQWMEVEAHTFSGPIAWIMHEMVVKDAYLGQPTDDAALAGHVEKLGVVLDVYDAHLKTHKYLAGDFFSLADLTHLSSLSPPVNYLKLGYLMDSRPHVQAWWMDVSARPAWQKVYGIVNEALGEFEASRKAN